MASGHLKLQFPPKKGMDRKRKEPPPNVLRTNCAMFGSIRLLCWQDILLALSEKALGSHRVMLGALGKRAKSVCRMSISGLMSLFPTFLCTCSTLILCKRTKHIWWKQKKICLTVNFKGWWNSRGFNCASMLGYCVPTFLMHFVEYGSRLQLCSRKWVRENETKVR